MDISVQLVILSAAFSIVASTLAFVLNKWAERKDELQKRKIEHYKILLNAISDLVVRDLDKNTAIKNFARAVNTIALIAPQYVIEALMEYSDEIIGSNKKDKESHNKKLTSLILAIRKSLELPFRDNDNFKYELISFEPR